MICRQQALRILIPLLCCVLCLPCWAQEPSAKEILRRVGETYRGLQSYQFVAEELIETFPDHISKSEISLSYSAPGKIRLEVRDNDGMNLLISDGHTRWIYLPDRKQYTAEPGSGDETVTREGRKLTLPTYRSLLVERFRNLPEKGSSVIAEGEDRLTVGADTIGCYFVRVRRQDGSVDELWVDKDRYIVWKNRHAFPNVGRGTLPRVTITVLDAKLNVELEKGTFQFDPPTDAKKVRSFG